MNDDDEFPSRTHSRLLIHSDSSPAVVKETPAVETARFWSFTSDSSPAVVKDTAAVKTTRFWVFTKDKVCTTFSSCRDVYIYGRFSTRCHSGGLCPRRRSSSWCTKKTEACFSTRCHSGRSLATAAVLRGERQKWAQIIGHAGSLLLGVRKKWRRFFSTRYHSGGLSVDGGSFLLGE